MSRYGGIGNGSEWPLLIDIHTSEKALKLRDTAGQYEKKITGEYA